MGYSPRGCTESDMTVDLTHVCGEWDKGEQEVLEIEELVYYLISHKFGCYFSGLTVTAQKKPVGTCAGSPNIHATIPSLTWIRMTEIKYVPFSLPHFTSSILLVKLSIAYIHTYMKINLKNPDPQGYLVILQSVMDSHLGNDILSSGQMSFLIISLRPMSPLGWGRQKRTEQKEMQVQGCWLPLWYLWKY